MTHEEMIQVIMAHRDGKEIQMKSKGLGSKWFECPGPMWNFGYVDYRVKPEPRRGFCPDAFRFDSYREAHQAFPGAQIIEFVEVENQ
jgi:hypothetical protein